MSERNKSESEKGVRSINKEKVKLTKQQIPKEIKTERTLVRSRQKKNDHRRKKCNPLLHMGI